MALLKNLNKWMVAFILISICCAIVGLWQYGERSKLIGQIDTLNSDIDMVNADVERKDKETIRIIDDHKNNTEKNKKTIKRMAKRIKKLDVPHPETVRTVYRDRVEYVEIEKKVYVKLYEFSLAIKTEFPDFIDINKSVDENVRGILGAYIELKKDYFILCGKAEKRELLYKKLRSKRFGFVLGGGTILAMDGSCGLGFFVGYAWIIK